MNFTDTDDDAPKLNRKPVSQGRRAPRRRKGRGCLVWLGLALAVLVVLAVLPRVLSCAPVRRWVLVQVNERIAPARLEAEWRLRWFGMQRFDKVVFDDASRGIAFECERVEAGVKWLSLIPPVATPDLGRVEVVKPRARVDLEARAARVPQAAAAPMAVAPGIVPPPRGTTPALTPGTVPPPRGTAPALPPEAAPPEAVPPPRGTAPVVPHRGMAAGTPVRKTWVERAPKWLRGLCMELVVTDGEVVLATGPDELRAVEIGGNALVRTFKEPAAVKGSLALPAPGNKGRIAFDGKLPALDGLAEGLARYALGASLTAAVEQLDLVQFNPLWRLPAGPDGEPHAWLGNGALTGRFHLAPAGPDGALVETHLMVPRLALQLPDGQMTEQGALTLKLAAGVSQDGWVIHEADFSSAWLAARAEGTLYGGLGSAIPKGGMKVETQVFADRVFKDFAPLLPLPGHVELLRGTAKASLEAEWLDTEQVYTLDASMDQLQIRYGQHVFDVTPAPLVRAVLERSYTSPPVLEALELHLPFLKMTGSGSLEKTEIKGGLDFDYFVRTYGVLLEERPKLSGAVVFEVRTAYKADDILVDLSANTIGLAATLPGRPPLVVGNGAFTLSARVPLEGIRPQAELRQAKWTAELDSFRVQGSCARLVPPLGGKPLFIRALECGVTGDMGTMSGFFAPAYPLLATYKADGQASLNLTAESVNGLTQVRFVSVLKNGALETHQFNIREPGARLDGELIYNAGERSLRLAGVQLKATALSMGVPELEVTLPRERRAPGVNGSLSLEGRVADLAAWHKPGAKRNAAPQGDVKLTLSAETPGAGGVRLRGNAMLSNTVYPLDIPLRIDNGTARLDMTLAGDGESIALHAFEVRSPPLDMDLAGAISDLRGAKHAALNGTATPDLAIASLFMPRKLAEAGLKLTGRQPRPVQLTADLADGPAALRSRGYASGLVFVESLSFLGLSAAPADVALTLKDGLLDLHYQPAIGDGTLTLNPRLLVGADPVMFALESPLPILSRVPLTTGLADVLLCYVNPFLKGSAELSGFVTASAATGGYLPLDATWRREANGAGNIHIEELKLQPGGLLAELLGAMGMSLLSVSLDDYTSAVTCVNGWIKADPMVLDIKDIPVRFSGTAALDGRLNYLVTLPVTETLIGKTAMQYVKDTLLTIPLTGTVSRPSLNTSGLARQIKNMVRDAARDVSREKTIDLLQKIHDELRKD